MGGLGAAGVIGAVFMVGVQSQKRHGVCWMGQSLTFALLACGLLLGIGGHEVLGSLDMSQWAYILPSFAVGLGAYFLPLYDFDMRGNDWKYDRNRRLEEIDEVGSTSQCIALGIFLLTVVGIYLY